MKKHITISEELSLPSELAARTQAILAMKGVGKTYVAMKETEEMLKLKQQVVCFDPTGVWFGLRSGSDGKSEGFPILIFGGDSADAPLEPTAGEYLADFVQDSGRSVIFDMSHFESNAAQDRFVTDFATRLYRRKAKKTERNTIHLMLDEADSFAPQRPAKNQLKMLGAWEAIVRRGRSRGIGLTMITQRPAVINKNVLSQVDLLVCLRIVGIHDFKAVKEWTDLYATAEQKKEFMESLPSLRTGEGWFWSPGWLRIFQRSNIDKKITFDSSRTPSPGERAKTPKKFAAVDINELTEQIKATVEEAQANDPKVLRSKLKELEGKLAQAVRQAGTPKATGDNIKARDVARYKKMAEEAMQVISRVNVQNFEGLSPEEIRASVQAGVDVAAKKIEALFAAKLNEFDRLKKDATRSLTAMKKLLETDIVVDLDVRRNEPITVSAAKSRLRPATPVTPVVHSDGDISITTAEQRIIDATEWWHVAGVAEPKRHQVAFVANYTVNGHFNNLVGGLRGKGLVEYPQGGGVKLTTEGQSRANSPGQAPTRDELISRTLTVLKGDSMRKIFQAVVDSERELTREELAGLTNYTVNGHFNNLVGALHGIGVIDYPSRGGVVLAPLFNSLQ